MNHKALFPALMAALLITGCSAPAASFASSASSESVSSSQAGTVSSEASSSPEGSGSASSLTGIPDDLFSNRDLDDSFDPADCTSVALSGTSATITGKGAACTNGIVTISAAGDYLITGELTGQLVVDATSDDKIRLIFNGVTISCENSAPVYVKQADKVVITLAEGSQNSLTDGAVYQYDDPEKEEPSAALFSKDDLSINGSGTLSITASCNNAIQSKDDLRISGGIFNITAADKALVGRDSLAVCGGTFTLNTQGDAVKATNDEDPALGYAVITGGVFDITAEQDAFSAETLLAITGGTFRVTTGGGSVNTSTNGQGMWGRYPASPTASDTQTISAKGLKAGSQLLLSGGEFQLDTSDDAIHCNGDVTISGGVYQIATGDDGVHADAALLIEGCDMSISESYEGLEGANITLAGGTVRLTASDDGINAAGGSDGESAGWRRGEDSFSSNSNYYIDITGGYYYVNAGGDGIDSNGNVTMSGGTVLVDGPENSGNGALDYAGSFTIEGGTLTAAGTSGMSQSPSAGTQHSVMVTLSGQQSGKAVRLEKEDGTEVITYTPAKSYNSIVLSCDGLTAGETYVLKAGGTVSGGQGDDGCTTGGSYSGETVSLTFTLSENTVTYLNESGVTTGNAGGMGGFGGGMGGERGGKGDKTFGDEFTRPDKGTLPEGTELPEGKTGGKQFTGNMMPPDGKVMAPDNGAALPQSGSTSGQATV